MPATIVPRVTIEFTRDTVIRGPEGIVVEHKAGARIEAYRDNQSWRVPQDGGRQDYFVYPNDVREASGYRKVYEVAGAGFDGSTAETYERLLWVRADSDQQVIDAIADTGGSLLGRMDRGGSAGGDDGIDFELPGEAMGLSERLLEFASAERNKNRWTPK